ncbi:MAG: proprotein convertase P-domain-containing protein [Kofleriaceae bacterium]|nr:proprotein convertase P-domain-containing protein [Kofleriaceae bacterium]
MRAWSSVFAVVAAVGSSGLAGACFFDTAGVAPTDAFVDPGDDGGGVAATWRDDSAADFGAPGATLTDAVVEPWGAIGPATWTTGLLVAHASDEQLFDTQLDGTEWATVATATPAGTALTSLAPVKWNLDRPRGIGVTSGDTFTYWAEGELRLEAGSNRFTLAADDAAFVELAAPGSDAFTRVVAATYTTPGAATYDAPTDGWYRIRLAVAESVGDAFLDLEHQPPGAAAAAPIATDRLRVSDAAVAGLTWTGFDDSHLLRPLPEVWLFDQPAFAYHPNNGAITDLGFAESDRFSMRFAGQVRVDDAGTYRVRLDTDDGHRLWIDGALVLDYLLDATQDHTTDPLTLDAGWHDLVVDFTDNTGNQKLDLDVLGDDDNPSGGEPIDAARLRPTAPRAERTAGVGVGGAGIPDQGEVALSLPITAPADATAIAVEVGYRIDHPHWSDLEIAVIAPDGTAYVVVAAGSASMTGNQTQRVTVPTPGEAVAGAWQLRVRDGVAGDVGSIGEASLTVRLRGGAAPIATAATYVSPIEDLGDVVGFDAVTWTGRLPAGTGVAVRLRTCAVADLCLAADWSPPVTTSGDRPAVTGARFAQYELVLTGDGDATPSVDAVEITYRAAP